jgi:glycosyltransferase involved in cell wall biosynthesis
MEFSIIIPTCNRADELRETIQSIVKRTVAGDSELLVVDNKSTDTTLVVKECRPRQRRGYARPAGRVPFEWLSS